MWGSVAVAVVVLASWPCTAPCLAALYACDLCCQSVCCTDHRQMMLYLGLCPNLGSNDVHETESHDNCLAAADADDDKYSRVMGDVPYWENAVIQTVEQKTAALDYILAVSVSVSCCYYIHAYSAAAVDMLGYLSTEAFLVWCRLD